MTGTGNERPLMRIAFVGLAAAVLGLTGSALAADRDSLDFSGVWSTAAYHGRLLPADGAPLPFTAEGRARYTKTKAGLKSGAIVDEAVHSCVPEGMPRALASAYPFQIVMTPEQVVFAHEANRAYRIVGITDKHADPKIWDPAYMGEGIGKWNGDTLIIDSTNFKGDEIYLDATGVPVSDKLHLTEQVSLVDGGKRLEDRLTVDDPVIFTKPWTARFVFERQAKMKLQTDWVCGERHRDVSRIMKRGAK